MSCPLTPRLSAHGWCFAVHSNIRTITSFARPGSVRICALTVAIRRYEYALNPPQPGSTVHANGACASGIKVAGRRDWSRNQQVPKPFQAEPRQGVLMDEIKGIARVRFHPGKVEEWKRLTEEAMEIVRTKDRGTLQYEI